MSMKWVGAGPEPLEDPRDATMRELRAENAILRTQVEKMASALEGAGRYIFSGMTARDGQYEFDRAAEARSLLSRLKGVAHA